MMGGLSPQIWFSQGVKQGCSLSPLLFALYISGLGNVLQNNNRGVQLGTEIITALFFAENLVLVSSTPMVGMNRLLSICAEFCKDMHMTLSIPKTYILSNAAYDVSSNIDDAMMEEVLVASYLGGNIRVLGRNLVGLYETEIVKHAQNYALTIMNLTHTGWTGL